MFYLWSFAAGLIHIPVYSFPWPVPLLLFAAILCLAIARRGFVAMGFVACGLLGMAIGSWNLQQLCSSQLNSLFDQTTQTISFTVVSIPKINPDSQIFLARIDSVDCEKSACPMELVGHQVRLSWYQAQEHIQAGDIWQGAAKLRRPRGFVNPYGFDYHAWLLAQGVVATGSIKTAAKVGDTWNWAKYRAELAAETLSVADSPYRRFWAALLIGDQNAINQAHWQRLQATGTVHLLVISGLHIGLVAVWCFWGGGFLARLIGCVHRGSNARVMQFVPPLLACTGAGFYAALAGFSIPTVRALTACLALMLCRVLGLNLSSYALLGAAVIVVGLNEPLAWESAGFWLSFLAVALLFYVFVGRTRQSPTRAFLMTQPLMAVGLMLPLWLLGQGVSLTSPFANLVAVPLVSFVLVPALFMVALTHSILPALAGWLLAGMDWVFSGLWYWLKILQELPVGLMWPGHTLSGGELWLAGAGILLLLAPAGLRVRGIGGLWLLLALLPPATEDFLLRVTVMDVGQGQAVVLQTANQTWLYDAGPRYSDEFEAGSRIVAPYLRRLGVHQLKLMISHADLDHAGGLPGVLSGFTPDRFMVGEPLATAEAAQESCVQGQSWEVDSAVFTVLWPPANSGLAGNNSSCVLLIELPVGDRQVRLLLPGDIDRATERKLLASLTQPVDWLLAPHHGSNSSSSYRLLYRARPQYVVFSAGYHNRYGHPHPKVLKRYQEMRAQMYNTATDGALIFTWTEEGLDVQRVRQTEARLWHGALVDSPAQGR